MKRDDVKSSNSLQACDCYSHIVFLGDLLDRKVIANRSSSIPDELMNKRQWLGSTKHVSNQIISSLEKGLGSSNV